MDCDRDIKGLLELVPAIARVNACGIIMAGKIGARQCPPLFHVEQRAEMRRVGFEEGNLPVEMPRKCVNQVVQTPVAVVEAEQLLEEKLGRGRVEIEARGSIGILLGPAQLLESQRGLVAQLVQERIKAVGPDQIGHQDCLRAEEQGSEVFRLQAGRHAGDQPEWQLGGLRAGVPIRHFHEQCVDQRAQKQIRFN